MKKFLLSIAVFFLSCQAQTQQEVRGVWLTNVDSHVLESREQIAEAMQFLADHHFNMVCPVVWNKGFTIYRSALMGNLFDQPIDSVYGQRDPLAELIEEAHQRNIAVIAWFEFGFSSSYQDSGGHLLATFPHWAAKDRDGNLLEKNGFEWMNAYHPEVQDFILELIREVATNYAVDGIQGDDRLPAQPSKGGYSDFTFKLFQTEHKGQVPPKDFMEPAWLKWRADKLTEFAGKVYSTVKGIDSKIMVTWSPSIYPWAYEEYLQDWPNWIRSGFADLIITQNYRYSIEEYKKAFDSQRKAADNLHLKKNILYPGVLMNVGDYVIDEDFLLNVLKYNRNQGANGEVFFFYEGLRKDNNKLAKVLLDTFYKQSAVLPQKPRFLLENN